MKKKGLKNNELVWNSPQPLPPENSKVYTYLMQNPSGMMMESKEPARRHYRELFNELKGDIHPASAEFPYANLMGLDAKLLRIMPYIQVYRALKPEHPELYLSSEDVKSFMDFIEKSPRRESGEDLFPDFLYEKMPKKFEEFRAEIEKFVERRDAIKQKKAATSTAVHSIVNSQEQAA